MKGAKDNQKIVIEMFASRDQDFSICIVYLCVKLHGIETALSGRPNNDKRKTKCKMLQQQQKDGGQVKAKLYSTGLHVQICFYTDRL
jgi:hypothetical protein